MGDGGRKRYNDAEVEEILRRAVDSQQADDLGLSHDDLVAAAREVGLDGGAVERAAREVQERSEVEERRIARRKQERQRFARSFTTYALVNTFLALIDFMAGPGWWVQWPLVIWGFFIALEAANLVLPGARERRDRKAEERYRRWKEREERKRRKREARRRRSQAENDFEAAIENGVAALLSTAARHLDRALAGQKAAGRGEFQRYVERQRAAEAPPPTPVVVPPPRARVEAVDPDVPDEVEADAEAPRRARRRHRRR